MTRQDYMVGKITHAQYYGNVAKLAGIVLSDSFVARVKAALATGDEHLNTIPLMTWDAMGEAYKNAIVRALRQVNNTRGASLSDLVSTLKQAAIEAATKGTK